MIWYIIQQKHAQTCSVFYRLIFQSLYHTSLILPKREIDEVIIYFFFFFCRDKQFITGLQKYLQEGFSKAI